MKTEDIKITPKWSKNKEEIWNDMFEQLDETPKIIEMKPRKKPVWLYIAAAVAATIILLPSVAFIYTKNEVVDKGSQLAVVLPDGSTVNLNAESEISYKPLWWIISRKVKLNGEAYFEVEKGSKFDVHSGEYTVSVLGTSFNVFSRINKFTVTCISGKVNVTDKQSSLILTPGMQAVLDKNRLIAKEKENVNEIIEWKYGKFVYVAVPLVDVIQEIERQYNIEVFPNSGLDYLYSGNFTRTQEPEDVLKIVGLPFGIEFKIK